MTKAKKAETPAPDATDLFPAADRVVAKTDNAGPENKLPPMLPSAEELPAVMKADLEAFGKRADEQLATFARVPAVIEDDEVYQRATTFGTQLTTLLSDVEKARKAVKAPYLAATTAIDGAYKLVVPKTATSPERKLVAEVEKARDAIKARLSARDTALYHAEQARIEKERRELAEAVAADGIVMAEAPAAEAAVVVTKSAHGGSSVKNLVTDWEVVDEAALPRSVLSVDRAKVQALIDAGATEIPGIRLSTRVATHVKR